MHLVRTPPEATPIWHRPEGIETGLHLWACNALIRELDHVRHRVIGVGGGQLPFPAGSTHVERLHVPMGHSWLATRALRRRLETMAPQSILICWSGLLRGLAKRAAPPETPITHVNVCDGRVSTSASGPGRRTISDFPLRGHWLHQVTSRREVSRASLGIEPDEWIIGMSGDVDIAPLIFVTGILQVAGLRVRGMVQAGSAGLRRARAHQQGSTPIRAPIVLEGAVTLALGACDLLLLAPRGPAQCLAVSLAHAAGVPVVAGPEPTLGGYFPGRLRECVARSWEYSDLAQVCRGLLEDEKRRRQLGMLAAAPSDQVSLGTQLRAAWRLAGVGDHATTHSPMEVAR